MDRYCTCHNRYKYIRNYCDYVMAVWSRCAFVYSNDDSIVYRGNGSVNRIYRISL